MDEVAGCSDTKVDDYMKQVNMCLDGYCENENVSVKCGKHQFFFKKEADGYILYSD